MLTIVWGHMYALMTDLRQEFELQEQFVPPKQCLFEPKSTAAQADLCSLSSDPFASGFAVVISELAHGTSASQRLSLQLLTCVESAFWGQPDTVLATLQTYVNNLRSRPVLYAFHSR